MTDSGANENVSPESPGQGDGNSDLSAGLEGQGGGKEGEAQVLTLDQVQSLIEQRVEKVRNEGRSYADKAVAAANRSLSERFSQIDAQIDRLKDSGMELPANYRDVLRNMAIEEHYAGEPQTPGEGEGEGPAGQQEPTQLTPEQRVARQAANEAMRRMRKAGVIITPDSPAAAKINQTTNDPQEFLASVDEAIGIHKQWLAGTLSEPDQESEPEGKNEGPGAGLQKGKGEGKEGAGGLKADATPREKFSAGFAQK